MGKNRNASPEIILFQLYTYLVFGSERIPRFRLSGFYLKGNSLMFDIKRGFVHFIQQYYSWMKIVLYAHVFSWNKLESINTYKQFIVRWVREFLTLNTLVCRVANQNTVVWPQWCSFDNKSFCSKISSRKDFFFIWLSLPSFLSFFCFV